MTHDLPARMLRLLSLLQTRRCWAGHELAERLGVTLRTVRRDIDRLREMGYPVDATTGPAGGYRLTSGTDLPPLLLDDDEAVAVALALRTASSGITGLQDTAGQALAKLEHVLPARLRHRVTAVNAATAPMGPLPWTPGPRTDPAVLATLAAACRDHEIISFDYRTRHGSIDRRRTEPHTLVFVTDHWYLLGYDTHHTDWRIYRADRITDPTATGHRTTARELPTPDPAAYVAARLAAAPTRYRLRVTAPIDAATATARAYALPERVHAIDDHTSTLDLASDNPRDIAAQLLGLAPDATVTGTPDLAPHLEQLGRFLLDTAHTLTTPPTNCRGTDNRTH
ncbi:WYL domain-containing protein [Nocardia terpenica]|uniref:DNA-binding transcriptional regulator n=1 Tax=Nocardia terpenica TaxID=455432 RepID=A0A164P1H0_9NOCA|nr:WYL domain-containing protein [Nocardia terpenica]KZM74996.1 DNA-binding transcriptional regulator [Nocardia terpenica]MBF6065154.1 WYL domain-containing protein [Nocardia terpenica]MBF6107882.1 WYL domain-containing protein [Nocardia terpenica]MBF6115587.1 WYL domain-containing protein [Nocardia terpenica]MBF6122025.1 WYL domain-containing protein [Nocardia terpenica]